MNEFAPVAEEQRRPVEAAGDFRTSMSLKSQKLIASRQQA